MKATAVEQAIREALVRACHKHMCTRKAATAAAHSSRRVVRVPARYCDLCSGQDNRLAVDGMLQAMQTAHCTKLLVAGGSPGTLDALNTLVADRCGLRVISGQDQGIERRRQDAGDLRSGEARSSAFLLAADGCCGHPGSGDRVRRHTDEEAPSDDGQREGGGVRADESLLGRAQKESREVARRRLAAALR